MKTTKKAIALILAVMTAMAIPVMNASAEAEYYIAESADSDHSWESGSDTVIVSVDTFNKIEGTGSIKVDMPSDGSEIQFDVFAMSTMLYYDKAVDLADWDYFEFCLYTEGEFHYDPVIQYNFIDTDVPGQDGYNCTKWLFTREYKDENGDKEDPNNFTDTFKTDGWMRLRTDRESILSSKAIAATSPDNISAMRLSWLYYSGGKYDEVDWAFDGIMYFNQDFLDERTSAEAEFAKKIDAATIPNESNFASVQADTQKLIDEYNALRAIYPNFMPENFEKCFEILTAYNTHFKAQWISEAEQAISSIGEITIDNYVEKEAECVNAAELVARLDGAFGTDYTLSNKGYVATATKAISDCKKAGAVSDAVKALGTPDELTLDKKDAVTAARSAFNKLNNTQKGYLPSGFENDIVAFENKIYELENPYVLGQVDDDDKITASDALMALQFSVGKIELTDLQQKAADVDLTDGVSAADALLILQYSVGKISTFPRSAN